MAQRKTKPPPPPNQIKKGGEVYQLVPREEKPEPPKPFISRKQKAKFQKFMESTRLVVVTFLLSIAILFIYDYSQSNPNERTRRPAIESAVSKMSFFSGNGVAKENHTEAAARLWNFAEEKERPLTGVQVYTSTYNTEKQTTTVLTFEVTRTGEGHKKKSEAAAKRRIASFGK